LISAATVAFLAPPSLACAAVHRIPIYIPPAGNFPLTQTVPFGAKTLTEAGASPLGYKQPDLLGSLRYIAITTITDKNGSVICGSVSACTTSPNSSVHWKIDDRNMLAPRNGANTYGQAWVAAATMLNECGAPGDPDNCHIFVADYTDSGHTIPAGGTSNVKVPILANTYTVREMTLLNRGCAINCEINTSKADAGATGTTTEQWQVGQILRNSPAPATPPCLGDTIIWRDAGNNVVNPTLFNPTNLRFDIKPPAAGWSACGGSGTSITMIAENPSNHVTLDSYGNPELKSGFRFGGGITTNNGNIGSGAIPLDIWDVYCIIDQTVTSTKYCVAPSTTTATGGGVNLHYARGEVINKNLSGPEIFFMYAYGPGTVDHNYAIGTGITFRWSNGGLTAFRNVARNLEDDFFSLTNGNYDIEQNFFFNPSPRAGNHIDFMQSLGADSTHAGVNFGTMKENFMVMNDTSSLGGVPDTVQCYFEANPTSGFTFPMTGADIERNGCFSFNQQGVAFSYWDNATIHFNATLTSPNTTIPGYTINAEKMYLQLGQGTPTATFNGTTTVTFTGVNPGTLGVGNTITGSGIAAGTQITGGIVQWNGTSASATVNIAQTVTSTATIGQSSPTGNLAADHNLANGFDFTKNSGTLTTSNNVTLAYTGNGATDAAAYSAVYPNVINGWGANLGITNYAAAIVAFTPSQVLNPSTNKAYNADGSWNGPIMPGTSGGGVQPCKNDGRTNFDVTKSCAAQSPPAAVFQ
jgi:hypothetical protein